MGRIATIGDALAAAAAGATAAAAAGSAVNVASDIITGITGSGNPSAQQPPPAWTSEWKRALGQAANANK